LAGYLPVLANGRLFAGLGSVPITENRQKWEIGLGGKGAETWKSQFLKTPYFEHYV